MGEKTQSLIDPSVLNDRTTKVSNYVEAYNNMDVENMIADFDDGIVFLNIMNGEKSMELKGIEEFKKQALDALSYFSEREQSIESITQSDSSTEIMINYRAIAAVNFPSGLKKGDEINLKGKSVFEFSADGKIIRLTDVS